MEWSGHPLNVFTSDHWLSILKVKKLALMFYIFSLLTICTDVSFFISFDARLLHLNKYYLLTYLFNHINLGLRLGLGIGLASVLRLCSGKVRGGKSTENFLRPTYLEYRNIRNIRLMLVMPISNRTQYSRIRTALIGVSAKHQVPRRPHVSTRQRQSHTIGLRWCAPTIRSNWPKAPAYPTRFGLFARRIRPRRRRPPAWRETARSCRAISYWADTQHEPVSGVIWWRQ